VLAMGFMVSTQADAASVSVPWFVDNSGPGQTLPPGNQQTTTIIYLNNSSDDDLVCAIAYFSQDGEELGPFTNNTFVIPALSTVAFRPVADDLLDPTTNPAGQESAVGAAVPNRPTTDGKKNGSIRITYEDQGGTVKVTGKSESWRFVQTANGFASNNSAYLLPD